MVNILFDSKASTQDLPRIIDKYILNNKIFIIQSFTQYKGKGTHNRKWYSPKGNLYFTIILKRKFKSIINMNVFVCYLIHKYFENKLKISLQYKWPNDLYYQDKKIIGILNQNEITGNLCKFKIGIGININNNIKNSNFKSISLKDIIKKKINILDFSNDIQTYLSQNILKIFLIKDIVNYLNRYLLLTNTKYKIKYQNKTYKNISILNLNYNLTLKIKIMNNIINIMYGELE